MKDVRVLVSLVLVALLLGYEWHAEHLRFVAGPVAVEGGGERPFEGETAVSSAPLGDGRLLVTAGPLAFEDAPRTLVLVLDPTAGGWRVENAGVYWSVDPPELSRWIEPLYGTIRIDSGSAAPGASVRCEVDVWCNEALEGRFSLHCRFALTPDEEPEGEPPVDRGPFDARTWVERLAETPLPDR